MTESMIENELLEATVFKPKKKEERQEYLYRLMIAVTKLEDEWEGLSKAAQDWTNDAAEIATANKDLNPGDEGYLLIEDFPDYPEDDGSEVEEVVELPSVAVKVRQKKEKVAAPQQRRVSACHTIKKIVVNNPTITVDDLSKQLKDEGFKVSDVTVATLRSDLRDTLRVLNELQLGQFSL